MVVRLTLLASFAITALAACATAAPALSADAFDPDAPLNPTLDDGRLLYRGYDDHHPTCFAFIDDAADQGGDTEELECPAEALEVLGACPSGKLFAHRDGRSCVCDPIGEEPPRLTDCP